MYWYNMKMLKTISSMFVVFTVLILSCQCQEIRGYQQSPPTTRIGVLYSGITRRCFSKESFRPTLNSVKDGPSLEVVWREVNHTNSVLVTRDVCDLVEAGVRGLITVLPHTQQTMVISQAEALRLPNLVIDLRPFRLPLRKNFSVQLNPTSAINSYLVKDILSALRWTTATIVFDDIIGSYQRESLQHELSPLLTQLHVISLGVISLKLIRVSPDIPVFQCPYRNFLFFGRGLVWSQFIQQRRPWLEDEFYWIVISDLTSQETQVILRRNKNANVLFVWEKLKSCINSDLSIQNHDNPDVDTGSPPVAYLEHQLMNAAKIYSGASPFVRYPDNSAHASCIVFRPVPLPTSALALSQLVTNWHLERKDNGDANPSEYDIYSSLRDTQTTLGHSGEWTVTNGLLTKNRNLFLNHFHDFGEEPILIAATEALPFLSRKEINGGITYTGFSVDILDELARHLHFNYTIIEPPDNFYGAPDENGTWNGMVGMVYRGEAEMAIGPFTITSLREQVIDFTVPFSEGSTGIMTLSPGYEANKSLFQTLKPYSIHVWLSIVAAIALIGCTSLLLNRSTPFGRKPEVRPPQAKYETSLGDNLWMVYSSVTEQGIQHSPEAVSGRCLIGFWWLFTILLVATYTANLAAFLTISLPPPPINTLGELLAQDKIQPIVQAGTSFETMFKNSHSDLYKRTWNRLQNSPKISHEASILDLVKAGQYAYISDRPVLDYLASQECQTYSVAEESFDVVGYGMVLPQGAPYGKTINRLIVKMQEAGLMDKWRHHWWSSNSSCRESSQALQSRLGLDSLGGLFLLYLGTVLLALLCSPLQVLFRKHCEHKR